MNNNAAQRGQLFRHKTRVKKEIKEFVSKHFDPNVKVYLTIITNR